MTGLPTRGAAAKDATRLSRRGFLAGGALVVSFALAPRAFAQLAGGGEGGAGPAVVAPELAGSLRTTPWLDAWIRIGADGRATVFTGKVELGQGIRTALLQVAAEELDMPPARITLVTADTDRTPDEGLTAGSHSMQDSGTAIRNAAANVRMLLAQEAARGWGVAADTVATGGDGMLRAADGRSLGYGDAAARLSLHVKAVPDAPLRDPAGYRTMGRDLPRIDIPAKLTGGAAYLHDLRLPGMLHARVVRGPSVGTRLREPDVAAVSRMPGVVGIVRRGAFLAVVAEREWTAVQALRHLQRAAYGRDAGTQPQEPLPAGGEGGGAGGGAEGGAEGGGPMSADAIAAALTALPARDIPIMDTRGPTGPAAHSVRARYVRPWISHGSIGPSCAVALFEGGAMTVWTHSQGPFDVHRVVAELVGLPPDKVRAIHAEGAGCYGQNGADDVAADAAVIAMATPGRPIRLQWMREQEFGWEPLGPGMMTQLEAALGADGRIVSWRHEVWSNPHNNRPVGAGGVLAGNEADPPFPVPEGKPIPMPEGDGSRNSNPLYSFANTHVVYHFIKDMPVRVSALRSLGAHLNVFSIESMLDELAAAANIDPLALRLAHMEDQRAREVMQRAADGFGWGSRPKGDGRRGCGMAFARYKNLGAYCAVALEVEVDRETGRVAIRRAVAAVDCGQPASPDGVRNQIEGALVQSFSWTSREGMRFAGDRRAGFDWSSYPILRFGDVPDAVEVLVMDRPGAPFLGTAEAAQGPTAAALANAIADATGIRLRDMPLSADRLKAALGPV
ncbi:xanthine dehydrogenase family protein molybdopterin-binding subunit [Azospirillum picis]|uniref:CO/xanthine dehydrogenase Mo-binding subunit n=1 Tax=Azospirillum picis TaxID=488438 RepID=A0ABU0MNC4_9PROT|nr:molybdopterin cofactor-binding domain-containing protein [Azospirillum picis]MBP2301852.1 CO/xanthine dehydrogenase Mo-binding subunit [Azospirillum picis]MDQ0534973.1 CO/xanthine dehydrogenase Mo-binding subunit [Azospirillum picis]